MKSSPYKKGTPASVIILDGWSRGFLPKQTFEELKLSGYTNISEQDVKTSFTEYEEEYLASFVLRENMTEYDCPSSCNNCGGENYVRSDPYSPYGSGETETVCLDCGFEDSWHFGFFQSGADGYNKSRKYSYGSSRSSDEFS